MCEKPPFAPSDSQKHHLVAYPSVTFLDRYPDASMDMTSNLGVHAVDAVHCAVGFPVHDVPGGGGRGAQRDAPLPASATRALCVYALHTDGDDSWHDSRLVSVEDHDDSHR